jgi:hypothetical protein
MKKLFFLATLSTLSFSAFAQDIQFENLSKSQVENVAREFSGNFSHTGVSAPETDGLWGVEVGVVGGQSKSPDLADVVDSSGGDGKDFEKLYHAGLQVRAHFPFDLFAEVTVLPEQEFDPVTVKNTTMEIGWNLGGFFGWPIDVALGVNRANSEISFTQDPVGSITSEADISLKSKTTIMWVGVSKTFLFVTPYVKFGKASADSEVDATADIFGFPGPTTSYEVENEGNYFAAGANLQFAFLKLGAEISKIMDVSRTSAKVSFDF